LVLFLIAYPPAQADLEELELKVTKNFGYQAGGTIQGRFTLTASGPQQLTEVAFMIDGEVQGVDETTPFQWQFSTSEYPPGKHELYALGQTGSGDQFQSEIRELTFISPEAVMGEVMKILIPISGALVLSTVAGLVLTMYMGRKPKARRIGDYGRAGGAVCGGCGFPFSRNLLSPNLVLGKLEKCPHCGKWSVAGRASESDLREAEKRLEQESQAGRMQVEPDTDRMRRLIEDSRFED
jgi:hypothetical protein